MIFAQGTRLILHALGVEVSVEGGGLVHHVFHATAFDRIEKILRLTLCLKSKDSGNGRAHVLAMLQRHDGKARVARRIGGDVDGLNLLVLDHLLTGGVGLFGTHTLGKLGAAVRVEIGGRDHLDIRVVLVEKRRTKLAQTKTGDAHLDLTVRYRLPALGGARCLLVFFKSWNDVSLCIAGCVVRVGIASKSTQTSHAQERARPGQTLNKSPAGHARKGALFQIHVAVFIAHILGIR